MQIDEIRMEQVVRYVTPLREGGSLPAIVEANDGFLYVMKFRGAGQGTKALIAELIGGELARAVGLNVPELVFLELDESFSKTEPDEEIQDLLKFSVGLNLGLHYLSGSITYDPLVSIADPLSASKVVILDSLITNIDRTHKNTNLLNWNKELWLIDHGASLYFQHSWNNWEEHSGRPFPAIKDHVLLSKASQLDKASKAIKEILNAELINKVVGLVPNDWLEDNNTSESQDSKRQVYAAYINKRLSNIDLLTKEASDVRKASL